MNKSNPEIRGSAVTLRIVAAGKHVATRATTVGGTGAAGVGSDGEPIGRGGTADMAGSWSVEECGGRVDRPMW